MKITYDDNRCRPESGFAVWLRRLILLWLVAVTVEYALLPMALRDLSRLDGIAAMSPLRMALVAALTAICPQPSLRMPISSTVLSIL